MNQMTRRSVKVIIAGAAFPIFLTTASVLIGLYGDVWRQDGASWWNVFLCAESEVKLSSLLANAAGPASSAPEPRPSAPTRGLSPPLYIFALDVSQSLSTTSGTEVTKDEVNNYLAKVSGTTPNVQTCLPAKDTAGKTFDIARGEVCRYLELLPTGSNAAVVALGSGRETIAPATGLMATLVEINGAKQTCGEFATLLKGRNATDIKSNFEACLSYIDYSYGAHIANSVEPHVVFVSDFDHDPRGDGTRRNGVEPSARERSECNLGRKAILKMFRELGNKNPSITFHFAVVRGASLQRCTVLRIAGNSLSKLNTRETDLLVDGTEDFDFLQGYEHAEERLVFFYRPGESKARKVHVKVDQTDAKGATLRLTVASEPDVVLLAKPMFRVTSGAPGTSSHHGSIVQPGEKGDILIASTADEVVIAPQETLEPRESARHRLLFSMNKPGSAGPMPEKTLVVPFVFTKCLDRPGAASIPLAIFLAAIAFGVSLNGYRRLARDPVGSSSSSPTTKEPPDLPRPPNKEEGQGDGPPSSTPEGPFTD